MKKRKGVISMKKEEYIGVFDSGVGGVSVGSSTVVKS